jgi:hypothetical protein
MKRNFSNGYNILIKYSSILFIDINSSFFLDKQSLKEKLVCKPVFICINSEESRNKLIIDLYNKSGIYLWYNNINGKCYIGSSINLYKRLSNYY